MKPTTIHDSQLMTSSPRRRGGVNLPRAQLRERFRVHLAASAVPSGRR